MKADIFIVKCSSLVTTVNNITTKYVYDGYNIVQEKNSSHAVTANLLVGLGLDEWYGRTQRGYSVVYLPDAMGSAIGLSGDAQKLIVSYSYEPYGKTTVTGTGNTYGNNFAYTGRENDGTGLYYYRARYYNPTMGRFISEDPIGLAGGPNLYGYVGGNPVQFVDPLGLVPDMNLFEPFSREWWYSFNTSKTPGWYTVNAHGASYGVLSYKHGGDVISADKLVDFIRADPNYKPGMPVILNACLTGAGDNPLAQQVANMLGAKVMGANSLQNMNVLGDFHPVNGGRKIIFFPN